MGDRFHYPLLITTVCFLHYNADFSSIAVLGICLSVRSFLNILAVCSRSLILAQLGTQVFSPCSIFLSSDYHNSFIYYQALTFIISSNIYHSIWTSLYVSDMINFFGQSPFTFSSPHASKIDLRAISNPITLRLTSILIHPVI